MRKTIIIALLVGNLINRSTLAAEVTFICSNMQGVSLETRGGKPTIESDGFSGSEYVVSLGAQQAIVVHKGIAQIVDQSIVINVNENERWVSFYAAHAGVTRLFTLYRRTDGVFLAMTEHQTQFDLRADRKNSVPQARTYFANCY